MVSAHLRHPRQPSGPAVQRGKSSDKARSFHAASTVCPLGTSKTVPVPSRLYTLQRSAAQPLAGLRLAIGDQFDLKGVPATQGSKAWTELYGPGAGTAGYVRRLIALGVVIVGKTKTSQFGLGTDWVDVHRPANPRADGYRNVGTSTAGAAAAMAAYDWLDFAVGAECELTTNVRTHGQTLFLVWFSAVHAAFRSTRGS